MADSFHSVNAKCNVYNGDKCCGDFYCHELPSFGATCIAVPAEEQPLPGHSEYRDPTIGPPPATGMFKITKILLQKQASLLPEGV